MIVKKAGNVIIGGELSKAEKKALEIEVRKATAEWDEKNTNEIDSMILYFLNENYRWGEKRLKEFHRDFVAGIRALCERYMMAPNEDAIWLCTHIMKERGYDIEAWNKEIEEEQ